MEEEREEMTMDYDDRLEAKAIEAQELVKQANFARDKEREVSQSLREQLIALNSEKEGMRM